jgi:hypothetical protein
MDQIRESINISPQKSFYKALYRAEADSNLTLVFVLFSAMRADNLGNCF